MVEADTSKIEKVDPTLEETIDALITWATDRKNAIISTGSSTARQSWTVLGDIKTVASVSALPSTVNMGEYRLGQLALAIAENTLHQITTISGEIDASGTVTLTWTHINQDGGSLFAYEIMNTLFSRYALERVYSAEYEKEGGRAGLAMVAKLQMDFLSAFERDSRYRYRTPLRSRFHHGANKRVEADPKGTLGVVKMFIEQAYKQLHAAPEADDGTVSNADLEP